MPIREFKCEKGHVTERLLFGRFELVKSIPCEYCAAEGEIKAADLIEISKTSFRLMPGGAGGFHAPSKG